VKLWWQKNKTKQKTYFTEELWRLPFWIYCKVAAWYSRDDHAEYFVSSSFKNRWV